MANIIQSRAARHGLSVVIKLQPWPEAGAVQRIADQLVIYIDSRQKPAKRAHALAHEAGHILFGHYEVSTETWFRQPREEEGDEWEYEADYFADFALRPRGIPPEAFFGEQLCVLDGLGL